MNSYFAQRPDPSEYAPYYGGYISLVPDGNLLDTLTTQHEATQQLLRGLPEDRAAFRPAAGEWSVKEVVGHMIDTERIFAYRALRFARGETQPLPGYDQDAYVAEANFDARTLPSLMEEWAALRRSHGPMLAGFSHEAWLRCGKASNTDMSARAAAWIIAGHELHHVISLKEKYL
jgi:uncharacterized damage-inducible protein DinB